MSKIEWTGKTWNPIIGCRRVSAGCENCYAERTVHRGMSEQHKGLTVIGKHGPRWNGKHVVVEHRLDEPLRRKKPTTWFVNSLSDLFFEPLPNELIAAIFGVMAACPQHTFQVLTKRPARAREWFAQDGIAQRVDLMKHVALAGRIREVFAKERILPIDDFGFDGYWITSRGRVLSDRRGDRRELKPMAGGYGHQRVMLYREGGQKARPLIHRLVLGHFDRPAHDGEQTCHIDGDPTNNALWNLRWGSQSDNWADRKRHGNARAYQKLTASDVDEIRSRADEGESAASISRDFDVSDTQIRNIVARRQWAGDDGLVWPLPGVWLGVSVEDQATADERIPVLLELPNALPWISYEPALEEVDLSLWLDRLRWVVVGGESGPGARPFDLAWARRVVNAGAAWDVPVFVKQLGANPTACTMKEGQLMPHAHEDHLAVYAGTGKRGDMSEWPADLRVRQMPA